ncbi:MAG TPA: 4Fe-4S binding protein, partial [Candidatus Copromorpha excrementigallinarum]|nr:4Fe-4S binding protein [Candidatus Copromorpha excrementigallinarum]
ESSVEGLRGRALRNMKSFDEMKIEPAISTVSGTPCSESCDKCIRSCMYDAITKEDGEIKVSKDMCTGCGLCTFICPEGKLKLDW